MPEVHAELTAPHNYVVRTERNLKPTERRAVYEQLLERSIGGKLPYGAIQDVARWYYCHSRTIARIWKQGRLSQSLSHGLADVATKMTGNCGRKKTRTTEEIKAAVQSVPHYQRQTLRALAANSQIPKTTLIRHMKEQNSLKARFSYVKPMLTAENTRTRLDFARSFLRLLSDGTTVFSIMHDVVHVDEKWFYLTRVKKKFYVYDDEEVAARSVKSKHFITKVMFLAAVARPRYDHTRKTFFDGKIGVWPFVEVVAAKRTSRNRPKGAPVTMPQNVNSDVYKSFVLD
ncbi:hypothetical protein AaE_014303, partial [Aphanomyces astaci]